MARGKQAEVLTQAKTAFRAIAGTLDSTIPTVDDLRTALCLTGRNPSVLQCQEAWDKVETEDLTATDRSINFEEFVDICDELPRPTKEDLLKAFQALDTDGSGSLDVDEFTKLLTQSGKEKMSKSEVEQIFREADANADGMLDYEEFVDMMMSTIKKCDALEAEKPLGKTVEKQQPRVDSPVNGNQDRRKKRNLRNKEQFSDYDTELVFSDVNQPYEAGAEGENLMFG